jgi:hypothetical protein
MLSHFKCAEASQAQLAEFGNAVDAVRASGQVIRDFVGAFAIPVATALANFRDATSSYLAAVVTEGEAALRDNMQALLAPVFEKNCIDRLNEVQAEFSEALNGLGAEFLEEVPWYDRANDLLNARVAAFQPYAHIQAEGGWPFELSSKLETEIVALLAKAVSSRARELGSRFYNGIMGATLQEFESKASALFRESGHSMWADIRDLWVQLANDAWQRITSVLGTAYPVYAEQRIIPDARDISFQLKSTFDNLWSDAQWAVAAKVTTRFSRFFNQSDEDIPRVWREDDDIEEICENAEAEARRVLALYTRARIPRVTWKDTHFEGTLRESKMPAQKKRSIEQQFTLYVANAKAEAERVVIAHTKDHPIPMAAWLLLMFLGSDVLLWILSHPALAILLFCFLGILIALEHFGLLRVLLNELKTRGLEMIAGVAEEDEADEADKGEAELRPEPGDAGAQGLGRSLELPSTPGTDEEEEHSDEGLPRKRKRTRDDTLLRFLTQSQPFTGKNARAGGLRSASMRRPRPSAFVDGDDPASPSAEEAVPPPADAESGAPQRTDKDNDAAEDEEEEDSEPRLVRDDLALRLRARLPPKLTVRANARNLGMRSMSVRSSGSSAFDEGDGDSLSLFPDSPH